MSKTTCRKVSGSFTGRTIVNIVVLIIFIINMCIYYMFESMISIYAYIYRI